MSIEVSYHDDGSSYSTHTPQRRKSRAVNQRIHDYALSKNVSSDGCVTEADVEYRSNMLKSVSRGYDDQRLKLPKNWTS